VVADLNCRLDDSGWQVDAAGTAARGWWFNAGETGTADGLACIDGHYWPGLGWVQVAIYDGALQSGSLPHELWHAHLARLGIPDHNHADPGFQPGGAVDQAAALLAH
jgi:hypothetical protein